MAISIDVDMADTALNSENHIDKTILDGLWDGHKR
jgi:hypothetical protein